MGEWDGVITDSDGRLYQLQQPVDRTAGSLICTCNWLTGEIPAELGSLTSLRRLYLFNNGPGRYRRSGHRPAWSLWLQGNQLTGEIPAELGNLANLQLYC